MTTPGKKPGYTDTPMLPHCHYRVHDSDRPRPRIVTPGTASTQDVPGKPPSDAVVLFDGKDLSGWAGKDGAAKWKLESGYVEVVKGTGNIWTKAEFGDCQLHVEWAAPAVIESESQGRGNSGVFLMRRYEIQVLDCYNNPTYADGTTAAIYGQYPPLVNACSKPGEWHTYDIIWVGPRFDARGSVVRTAAVTVLHNGVVVHHYAVLIGPTTHRKIDPWVAHPPVGALELQDHGNPVRFRNIWYRPLMAYDT